jgi:hypothetical protein
VRVEWSGHQSSYCLDWCTFGRHGNYHFAIEKEERARKIKKKKKGKKRDMNQRREIKELEKTIRLSIEKTISY